MKSPWAGVSRCSLGPALRPRSNRKSSGRKRWLRFWLARNIVHVARRVEAQEGEVSSCVAVELEVICTVIGVLKMYSRR